MAQFFIQQDPAIERRKQLAQALIQQGSEMGPVRTGMAGLDRLARALVGGWQMRQAGKDEKEREEKIAAAIQGSTTGADLAAALTPHAPRAAQQVQVQNILGAEQAERDAAAADLAHQRDLEKIRARGEVDWREFIAQEDYKRAHTPEKPTAGQVALDKNFAKEVSDFHASGGFADTEKQINQLRGVASRLSDVVEGVPPAEGEPVENLSGPGFKIVPDVILNKTAPAHIEVRDEVEEVVQRNLRLILGPQFTEQEGIRLIARAYNPNLEEHVNLKRVNRLIESIETAAKAKIDAIQYFEEHGTLKGWGGRLPTIDDLDGIDYSDIDDEEKPKPEPVGKLMIDANGNKAIMYPDGTYKEVD